MVNDSSTPHENSIDTHLPVTDLARAAPFGKNLEISSHVCCTDLETLLDP